MLDIYSWLLSIFILVTSLSIIFYQLMCLSDLELDHLNPYDSASSINQVVLVEFVSLGSLCLLHLMAGHWTMFLLCLPFVYYNVILYNQGRHQVDVTEIFNQMSRAKMQRIYKLGYLAFLATFSIFWMIWRTIHDAEEFV